MKALGEYKTNHCELSNVSIPTNKGGKGTSPRKRSDVSCAEKVHLSIANSL